MMLLAHYHVSILPQVIILLVLIMLGVSFLRANLYSVVGWMLVVIPGILYVWLVTWYSRMQRMWYRNFFEGMREYHESGEAERVRKLGDQLYEYKQNAETLAIEHWSKTQMNPMRAFGVERHHCLEVVDTPLNAVCCWCDEPIKRGEIGFTMDQYGEGGVTDCHWHKECFLRSVLGSVGHQKKECSCHGGVNEGDPEGMTKREAALAACTYAWEHGLKAALNENQEEEG